MRVLFFTDGPHSPGSRFRCLQLFPALEARGIRCEVSFAYDERYNQVFQRPWAPLYKLDARLRRVWRLLARNDADVLFLHKTALAFTGLPEWLRSLRSTPIVFDFDDVLHLGPGGTANRFREAAFRQIVGAADAVIAGNAHLAALANASGRTSMIPTVVDVATYTPGPPSDGDELVVGWIGTASNFPYLRGVVPQLLQAIERIPRGRLRIVSNGVLEEYERHPLVEHWRWSPDRELMALRSFDIGLMPLDDSEITRGKCGFKMLQYMAVGVPVVASAVGANVDIFAGSGAGFLVPPHGDWVGPLLELASSPELRRAAGGSGRAHVSRHYSIEAVIDRYVEILERVRVQASEASPRVSP